MRLAFVVVVAASLLPTLAHAASAASCAAWRATCVKRATAAHPDYLPQCEAKYSSCMASGCFTEGAGYGGATHCGLKNKK